MVAVLFRTLDAYRVFDSVFVMTAGAQRTETALVPRVPPDDRAGPTLGLGSAVSILLFLSVLLDSPRRSLRVFAGRPRGRPRRAVSARGAGSAGRRRRF